MVFEWDDKTSLANEAKHGVGLDFGCYLWDGRVKSKSVCKFATASSAG